MRANECACARVSVNERARANRRHSPWAPEQHGRLPALRVRGAPSRDRSSSQRPRRHAIPWLATGAVARHRSANRPCCQRRVTRWAASRRVTHSLRSTSNSRAAGSGTFRSDGSGASRSVRRCRAPLANSGLYVGDPPGAVFYLCRTGSRRLCPCRH